MPGNVSDWGLAMFRERTIGASGADAHVRTGGVGRGVCGVCVPGLTGGGTASIVGTLLRDELVIVDCRSCWTAIGAPIRISALRHASRCDEAKGDTLMFKARLLFLSLVAALSIVGVSASTASAKISFEWFVSGSLLKEKETRAFTVNADGKVTDFHSKL